MTNQRSVNISISVGRIASFTRKRHARNVMASTVTRSCGGNAEGERNIPGQGQQDVQ
jgi:hypothetical protein